MNVDELYTTRGHGFRSSTFFGNPNPDSILTHIQQSKKGNIIDQIFLKCRIIFLKIKYKIHSVATLGHGIFKTQKPESESMEMLDLDPIGILEHEIVSVIDHWPIVDGKQHLIKVAMSFQFYYIKKHKYVLNPDMLKRNFHQNVNKMKNNCLKLSEVGDPASANKSLPDINTFLSPSGNTFQDRRKEKQLCPA